MMHFATPVAAFDCNYNRYTTEDRAAYFMTATDLALIVAGFRPAEYALQGRTMRDVARRRYTWDIVGRQYFEAMGIIPQS